VTLVTAPETPIIHTRENVLKKLTHRQRLFLAAAGQSWLATIALTAFVTTVLGGGNRLVAGGAIIAAAVLAMNGLARTDMFLTGEAGPRFWQKWRPLRFFHWITNEGELAGIACGFFAGGALAWWGEELHIPLGESFTLLGIMSAANLAVKHITPMLAFIERLFGPLGRYAVIVLGSLLSSFTGEPAGAVFLVDYFKDRVTPTDRPRVATGLAATIGSGGGLLPFAAPPILIVWGKLQSEFGWSYGDLIAWVGVACVLHVLVTSTTIIRYIRTIDLTEPPKVEWSKATIPLSMLVGVVTAHMVLGAAHASSGHHDPSMWDYILWTFDIILGYAAYRQAKVKHSGHEHHGGSAADAQKAHEAAFTAKYQPTILAGLIPALELIGLVATPAIIWLGEIVFVLVGFAPQSFQDLARGLILFFLSAITSHFADNALASRVYIMIPISLMAAGTVEPEIGSFLAACVVMGALFGGLLTIPANLPNFYIGREMEVSEGAWFAVSWRIYWTCAAYLAVITGHFLML